ncbi:MAG: carboxypeptidase-like regulatory domain-containing protein, partial [Runella zeae]
MKYCLLFWICPLLVIAQRATLKGVVQSNHAEALPFVTVTLKNTKFATTSDQQGNYQMKDIPYGEYEVEFSFVGFQSQTKTISIKQPSITENVRLVEAIHELNEVVVAAEKQSNLQQQKAISIKSIDIKEVITQNSLLTDVADRISGVRIRRSSSLGEKSDISINGMRGNAVRVYIDGLPMEFLYPNFDISTLPLSNIKRVDVFKGVLPVDVGTDAMGGAINIITEQKAHSHLRASYSVGSFNTHLADVEVGLANKNNFFF